MPDGSCLLPAYDAGRAGRGPARRRPQPRRAGRGRDATATCSSWRPSRSAVVVLVDGLGYDLLRQRSGHAPFLRSLLPAARRLAAGFPSTTATSMGTFGTGLPPGAHGLVGYEVLVPGEDRLLNELSWENGPDPRRWQPQPTVFEQAAADGVAVTRIGPGFFDGSGLTNAALRGGSLHRRDLAGRPGRRGRRGRPAWRPVAGLPLLGRARQGRSRARLPVLGVGRRAGADRPRDGPAGRRRAVGHRRLHHRRPRHGRRPARAAHRPGPRRRAGGGGAARRRRVPGAAAVLRGRRRRPTSSPPGGSGVGERAWVLSREEAVAPGLVRPGRPARARADRRRHRAHARQLRHRGLPHGPARAAGAPRPARVADPRGGRRSRCCTPWRATAPRVRG